MVTLVVEIAPVSCQQGGDAIYTFRQMPAFPVDAGARAIGCAEVYDGLSAQAHLFKDGGLVD